MILVTLLAPYVQRRAPWPRAMRHATCAMRHATCIMYHMYHLLLMSYSNFLDGMVIEDFFLYFFADFSIDVVELHWIHFWTNSVCMYFLCTQRL